MVLAHEDAGRKREDSVMSKKNSLAAQPKIKVEVLPADFNVTKRGGKEEYKLNARFIEELIPVAKETGSLILTAAQGLAKRQEIAIRVTQAFLEYKRVTKANGKEMGLPLFIHQMIDSTAPLGYGKVGTPERDKWTTNPLCTGIEAMVKRGQKALALSAVRQSLVEAKIDPDNADKVKEHNAHAKQDKEAAFQAGFNAAMLAFHRHGVTEKTIHGVLVAFGKVKKERDGDGNLQLTDAAAKIREEALKHVLLDIKNSDIRKEITGQK
jgi:hypothetical protein